MSGNDKTQRIPEPKTTKLARSERKSVQGTQDTSRGTPVTQSGGMSKGKKIAVAVTIVLLICALGLSLAWGFGLFNKQDVPQQETTEEPIVPQIASEPELTGDGNDISYTRYGTGDVSLEYPSTWSVMTYEGAQTVVVTRGTVEDGYIKIASASVSTYGVPSVLDASSMRAFVAAVAQSEQIDVDVADLGIGQRGAMWVATVSRTGTIGSKDAKGVQMIAASGDQAYLITALCPTDTYAQEWPYFQHVLDSISFNASAEFPDEGRD